MALWRQGARALGTAAEVRVPLSTAPEENGACLADLSGRSKRIVTMNASRSLREAVETMGNKLASSVLVEKDGDVVGIIKESNIIDLIACSEDRNLPEVNVGSVMDTKIQFASPESTVQTALRVLHETKLDYVPVAEVPVEGYVKEGQVKSMLSANVIIQQVCDNPQVEKALELSVKTFTKLKEQRLKEAKDSKPFVLNTLLEDDLSVSEIIRQMHKHQKGSVAVMEDCRDVFMLKGIVTEQDIIRRALCKNVNLRETSVADIMTSSNLITVTSKDTLLTCVNKMNLEGIRHLPVVSHKGTQVLSMISSKDIIAFLCDLADKTAQNE